MRKSAAIGCTLVLTLAMLAGCTGTGPDDDPSAERTPTVEEPDSTESPSEGSDRRGDQRDGGSDDDADGDDDERAPAGPPPVPRVRGTVASDFTTPWGIVFLEDDSALLSERNTGRIIRVMPSGQVRPVGTVPDVDEPPSYGEGGLLGIEFADDTLYAYRTVAGENQVIAMDYTPDGDGGLGEPRVLLDDIPQDDFHNAGRIVFGPDDLLYVATGDGREPENAQDLDSLGGKILRVTPEGEPAPGNPFDDSPVWSYGHRNIEGLAFDDQGRLWASEFGEDAWDELNLIQPGENYGWPQVEGMGEGDEAEEYRNPVHVWSVAEASPAGLAYADGALWMAALRGERLWRIDLAENAGRNAADPTRGEPRAYFTEEYGRLRTVEPAPDGSLWLTTSNTDGRDSSVGVPENDDRILRVRLTRP